MTRNEIVDLVRRITDCDGTESEIDDLMEMLKQNVPHPNVLDLIFWPDEEMTPEQIVDKALACKPIAL